MVLNQVIRSQSSLSLRSDMTASCSSQRSQSSRADPLKLYEQYRRVWRKHKAPGEKTHKDLRWSIREQMLEKHVIVKVRPAHSRTWITSTLIHRHFPNRNSPKSTSRTLTSYRLRKSVNSCVGSFAVPWLIQFNVIFFVLCVFESSISNLLT